MAEGIGVGVREEVVSSSRGGGLTAESEVSREEIDALCGDPQLKKWGDESQKGG